MTLQNQLDIVTLQQSIKNLPIANKTAVCKKIKTLVNLAKGVDVNSSLVFIDPTILVIHLLVLVERSGSNTKYFGL